MAAHLITDKRLLTHYCNKLDTIISRFKGEELETLNVAAAQGESASQYTRESLQRLSEAIGALDTVTHNIKQTMTEYATKFTELDYPTEKDKQDFEEYSAKAEKALISATDYLLVLKARVHAFIVVKAQPEHNQHSGSVQYLEEEISTDEMLAVYMKNTKPDPTPTKPEKRRSDRTKTGDTTADQGASRKTSPPLSEGKKPKARDTERNPTHKETRKVNALHEDNSETEAVSALDLQPVHKTRRTGKYQQPVTHIIIYATFRTEERRGNKAKRKGDTHRRKAAHKASSTANNLKSHQLHATAEYQERCRRPFPMLWTIGKQRPRC
ncbi:unnamed protein product [Cylicocyclus nassatus]|uniref:Uncharacterized protein n=1 Tax=Cylicocyclus nassatus TaxID=53992 RepID=A0AA36DQ94_CYLNA|nr:unnamed protein product [Cylicocyclus nassatus]